MYYMCYYTMLREPILNQIKKCYLGGWRDYRNNNRYAFECAMYLFCPGQIMHLNECCKHMLSDKCALQNKAVYVARNLALGGIDLCLYDGCFTSTHNSEVRSLNINFRQSINTWINVVSTCLQDGPKNKPLSRIIIKSYIKTVSEAMFSPGVFTN